MEQATLWAEVRCSHCGFTAPGNCADEALFWHCDPRPGSVPIDRRAALAEEEAADRIEINAARARNGLAPLSA